MMLKAEEQQGVSNAPLRLLNLKGNCYLNGGLQLLHSFNPEWMQNISTESIGSNAGKKLMQFCMLRSGSFSSLLQALEKAVQRSLRGPQEAEVGISPIWMLTNFCLDVCSRFY